MNFTKNVYFHKSGLLILKMRFIYSFNLTKVDLKSFTFENPLGGSEIFGDCLAQFFYYKFLAGG